MSQPVIQVRNLSKAYRLGVIGRKTLQDEAQFWWHRLRGRDPAEHMGKIRPGGRAARPGASGRDLFWALDDVSFEVRPGDVVGIIGRNGAGKSTLLKILSRITEPTAGEAEIEGRWGSLLEVGTGFHPDLTGRENVYMNGTILGMKKAEIDRKFDEIVAFSEVERFLDTPVKRYSSGMMVRLAFAVAAHLETEILIVDEVLAVGDAAFQKKCLGKMGSVAGEGRTVLFVSHQMNAVRNLCNRCLWLEQGRLVAAGDTEDLVTRYLDFNAGEAEWRAEESAGGNPRFQPTRLAVVDAAGGTLRRDARADEKIGVCIEGVCRALRPDLILGFELLTAGGESVFISQHTDTEPSRWPALRAGRNRLVAWIPPHLLNEGTYRIELVAFLYHSEWICRPLRNSPSIKFHVRGGLSESPHWIAARPGAIAPHIPFEALPPEPGPPG